MCDSCEEGYYNAEGYTIGTENSRCMGRFGLGYCKNNYVLDYFFDYGVYWMGLVIAAWILGRYLVQVAFCATGLLRIARCYLQFC